MLISFFVKDPGTNLSPPFHGSTKDPPVPASRSPCHATLPGRKRLGSILEDLGILGINNDPLRSWCKTSCRPLSDVMNEDSLGARDAMPSSWCSGDTGC